MQQCENCIWNGECDLDETARDCEYFSPIDDDGENKYINDLGMRHEYYMELIKEMQS